MSRLDDYTGYIVLYLILTMCQYTKAFSFLYTAHCDSLLTNTMTSTDTITIISGTVPALQGHNITFSCFGNEFLSICSEGGYWNPDPEVVCQSKNSVFNCLLNLIL